MVILKNFASINPGILFKKGNEVSTISPQNTILAVAKIPERIPKEFGIYDLNNFLSVNSLFKGDSELEFGDKYITIKGIGGRSKIKYRVTDKTMIVAAPDSRPEIPGGVAVQFTFTKDDFEWMMKTSSVLGAPHIAVTYIDGSVHLLVFNDSDDSAHTNSLEITGVVTDSTDFKLIYRTEMLKVIPDTYTVEIGSTGISTWTSTTQELKYWITTEINSKYTKSKGE